MVSQFLGEPDIRQRDVADALGMNGGEIDLAAEGEAGQDGQFVGGVDPVHVEAGVGLGVAERPGFLEYFGDLAAAFAHGGEDKIARAVEDAVNAAQAVGGEPLAQSLDDGDAAGHRGLVGEGDAGRFAAVRERRAVMGDQRLVGGDHVLGIGDGGLAQLLGDAVLAADQFHHHVHVGVGGHGQRVVEPADPVQGNAAVLFTVPRRNGAHHDCPAAAVLEQRRMLAQ